MTPKEKSIKVWELLRDNPGMVKEEAFDILGFDNDPDPAGHVCQACNVALSRMPPDIRTTNFSELCAYCPVQLWSDENGDMISPTCTGDNGLITAYASWEWIAVGEDTAYSQTQLDDMKRNASLVLKAIKENWEE